MIQSSQPPYRALLGERPCGDPTCACMAPPSLPAPPRVDPVTAVETHRKKPVDVQMMLWDGTRDRGFAIQDWVGRAPSREYGFLPVDQLPAGRAHADLWVAHNGSWSPLPVGYRVAREIDGSGFYPLSPEGFAAEYVQDAE